jgi:hypothetical protein
MALAIDLKYLTKLTCLAVLDRCDPFRFCAKRSGIGRGMTAISPNNDELVNCVCRRTEPIPQFHHYEASDKYERK